MFVWQTVSMPRDISVKQATGPERGADVNRAQALIGEFKRSPTGVNLAISLQLRRKRATGSVYLTRSYVLECRTPAAVRLVRSRLAQLMKELDGITVVDNME